MVSAKISAMLALPGLQWLVRPGVFLGDVVFLGLGHGVGENLGDGVFLGLGRPPSNFRISKQPSLRFPTKQL